MYRKMYDIITYLINLLVARKEDSDLFVTFLRDIKAIYK